MEIMLQGNIFFFNITWRGKRIDKNSIRISMISGTTFHCLIRNAIYNLSILIWEESDRARYICSDKKIDSTLSHFRFPRRDGRWNRALCAFAPSTRKAKNYFSQSECPPLAFLSLFSVVRNAIKPVALYLTSSSVLRA